jgi:4-amino-4-deoxy-L-arabinose transferase-like glycosyltransferase
MISFKFPQKYINLLLVILLAVVFFVSTSSFNYLSQTANYTKWSSPDETANYFFTKRFSQTGQLSIFDPANIIGDNLVMPRSVRSDFGWIKPVSFLGIILIYGSLAYAFGLAVIPFLTPLFAALGIILFYVIIKRLFSERVGLWSACLLAAFPVYIYYTCRSMFHNVLFIVLLLAALYLFILALGDKAAEKNKFLSWSLPARSWAELAAAFFSGFFVGLAVITRTSELLWLGPTIGLVWLFYIRRLGISKPILFLAGAFLALLPAAYYNQILYGSFWYGGYNAMNYSLDNIAKTSGALWEFTWSGQFSYYRHALGLIFWQVFYFGFNSDQSVAMFRHYVSEMFPSLLGAGLFGFLVLVGQNCRRFQKKYLVYVLTWLLISVILVFYYGSWKFNDNPDLNHFTIGNSYTRYWLPLYLGLMPLAALAIVRLSRALLLIGKSSPARIRNLIATGLQTAAIIVYVALSVIFVLYGSEEGLAFLYYTNQAEKINTTQVWSLTEPSAIIITRYYDKFFWPERRVIMGTIPDNQVLAAAAKLVKFYPVYYYNFYLNEADVNYLNNGKLSAYALRLRLVKKVNAKFGLYKMEKAGS